MRTELYRREVLRSLEGARGTYIYEACLRDLEEKTSALDPCGYRRWLAGLLGHLRDAFDLQRLRILDFGCGSGEFTVMMNLMGYDATGVDVSDRALGIARVLAGENGIAAARFVKADGGRLPFESSAFDVVVMISSLEHIDDATLGRLVPELARVCTGVVFVQVPSPMKVSDDHTGLRFVPWMPRALAERYVAIRGRRYRYAVSESGRWDVVYRNLAEIQARFAASFDMTPVPPRYSYPPCGPEDAVFAVGKTLRVAKARITLRVPLVHRMLKKAAGTRIEHFYPYYNLAFRKRCA